MNFAERTNPGLRLIRPYVPGKPVQELLREGRRSGSRLPRVVKMASNENPLGMSPAARRAMRRAARSAHQYPESSAPMLRDALAAAVGLPPEQLIVGNGADAVIWCLGMALLDDGDQAVVPDATFPLYETICRAMRAEVVRSRMDGYRIDLEDMLRRITSRTKAVWLCNPNNPTGTLVAAEDFVRFYERVPPSVFVIHDEVYGDFASPELFPDTVEMIRQGAENLFLLRSCSKLYGMAGLRVGYGVGAAELIGLMTRARPPFDVSVPAQEAARAALKDRRFVRRTLSLNRRGMGYLTSELHRLGLRWAPSETNFLLLDTGRDSREVCRRLEGFGIIARAADKYGYPNHIRVTVGRKAHNRRFVRALEQICSSRC